MPRNVGPVAKMGDALHALKVLKRSYKREALGHRKKVILFVVAAYTQALAIRRSGKLRKRFYEVANVPEKRRKQKYLDVEVMMYLAGGKRTRGREQEAWKRVRAISYLFDNEGVRVADLATQIQQRGGIEKVAREAAEKSPRKKRKSTLKPIKSNGRETVRPKERNDQRRFPEPNDQLVPLQVAIQMSDRDHLSEMTVGDKARLVIKRIDSSPNLIRVIKIVAQPE